MPLLRPVLAFTAILFGPLAGCALEGDAEPSPFETPADTFRPCPGCTWGPPLLNSHGLNGIEVSALDTNGEAHDGWQLLEVVIPGDLGTYTRVLHDVHAEDGVLYGLDEWGTPISAEGFVGSRWTVAVEATGEKEVMQIVDYTNVDGPSRYTFIVTDVANGVTDPKIYTCPEQEPGSGDYAAVLFADLDVKADSGTHVERANTIYFGCTHAAVGKAAMWGYSPWDTDDETHQTASRAVRADYCGVGQSYTVAGTKVQLADIFGINGFGDPNAYTEAFWGPEGALCIKVPRHVEVQDVACAGSPVPFCSVEDDLKDWKGALIWSKVGQ
ncbi:MAG: hypothetical protein JNK45_29335 [Myxococcales bacterium]|nr:hypothetical protein [Myxococcales bacterium]